MNASQSQRSEPAEPPKGDRPTWFASPILRGFFVMVLLGVVGAALGASFTEPTIQPQTESDVRRLPVSVITVQPVDSFQVIRTYTGTVAARRSSDLGFERAAIVTSVAVDQGDQVKAGQTIAQLDIRQLQIQLGQIQSQRDEAMAVLDELKAGPRVETIAAARASVEDLKAQVELQQRLFRRSSELVKEYAT
ncbi:MAG: biotin/lipoyl-binding protein, partial [Planctomycetota bacterium]